MSNELTPQEEKEIAEAMQKRIDELKKESLAIDFCRGKGITLDKMTEIDNRQREIEEELTKLKTPKPSNP